MPSDPAEILIYNEIEARANNIKRSNGYHTGVEKVERSRKTPFTGGDWPCFSFWPTFAPQDDDEYGGEEHTLSVVLGYFDMTRDEPFADLTAKMKADVVVAMNRATSAPAVDDSQSVDLGGLVSSFEIIDCEFIISEGKKPWCGVLLEIRARYSSPTADPFTITT